MVLIDIYNVTSWQTIALYDVKNETRILVTGKLTETSLPANVPIRSGLSIVYLGLIGSVLGFALYFYILRNVEATRVALITLITPVMALMLGNLLNGEAIQIEVLVGAAAILSGLLLYHLKTVN